MRRKLRTSPSLVPAALVALSLAGVVGALGHGGPAVSERRSLLQDQEQAVASLMACLEAAAKSLTGSVVGLAETHAGALPPVLPSTDHALPPRGPRFVADQHRLHRLNLPPPTAPL